MEEFKKIQKPQQRHINIDMPTAKAVTVPKYDTLAKEALVKDKYLSEFKSEADKQKARDNLGIGNSFKVVGEFDTLEELQSKVLVGKESEAYLIGNDIYTWSEALQKWFRYGASGSSAYEIAVSHGYEGSEAHWVNDILLKSFEKFNILYDSDIWSAERLYKLFTESGKEELFTITYKGAVYDVQLSTSPNMVTATFGNNIRHYIMCIQKLPNLQYNLEINFIEYE